jgi:hypothetical protein
MGMKAKGEQLKGTARKLYIQLEKVINSRRKESPATKESHRSSARQFAQSLRAQGPQNIKDIKPKHAAKFIEERIAAGVGHGQLEKDMAMINYMYESTGRPELKAHHNPIEVKRTREERINPKTWSDPEDRQARQIVLETASVRYGLAARNSMENGTRRAESLAARWIITKETIRVNNKDETHYWSNWGTKNPVGDMHRVTLRQIRYMYATDVQRERRNTPKDWAFEKKYLATMREKQAYLYVGKESKNGTKHLVPLEHHSQFDVIKDINKFCIDNGTKTLAPAGKTFVQAVVQFADALRAAGITKDEAGYTLHVDRHEYVMRSTLSDEELILALGHSDVRKIDSYRPRK